MPDSKQLFRCAYGKFDPDTYQPPFSNWPKAFTAVEIDLFGYFLWKPKVSAFFSSWVKRKGIQVIPKFSIRVKRTREEYQEALACWIEMFEQQTLYFLVQSGRSLWEQWDATNEIKKLPPNFPFYFEWGREDSPRSVAWIREFPQARGWVVDPSWHTSFLKVLKKTSIHFKLHGWNEERWVRRYGVTEIEKLKRIMKSYPEASMILSYSGKVAEVGYFFNC